jgi:hypothetical protein
MSVYGRTNTGGTGEIAMVAFNDALESATQMYDFDAGEWIPYTGGNPTSVDTALTESFVQYKQTLVAPATGKIVFLIVGTGGPSAISYFDDFSLTKGAGTTTAVFADGLQTKVVSGALSNTPTEAEFTALLGAPDEKNGLVVFVKDTANSKRYFVVTDGTEWYYSLATQAL